MNLDLNSLITPEIRNGIRLMALVAALLHMLIGIVLFRQILGMLGTISSRGSGLVRVLAFVHILILVGILILVIIY